MNAKLLATHTKNKKQLGFLDRPLGREALYAKVPSISLTCLEHRSGHREIINVVMAK